jgi:cytochrome oxidase Cu insertion factor (SCO1/SenC/PrrC family)
MDKKEALKEQVEHMNNRTQWHEQDVQQAEKLRNELSAVENDGQLTDADKENNKVIHHH